MKIKSGTALALKREIISVINNLCTSGEVATYSSVKSRLLQQLYQIDRQDWFSGLLNPEYYNCFYQGRSAKNVSERGKKPKNVFQGGKRLKNRKN